MYVRECSAFAPWASMLCIVRAWLGRLCVNVAETLWRANAAGQIHAADSIRGEVLHGLLLGGAGP